MKMKRLLTIGFALGLLSIASSCKKEETYNIKFVNFDETVLCMPRNGANDTW